jgi:hypothetical protein
VIYQRAEIFDPLHELLALIAEGDFSSLRETVRAVGECERHSVARAGWLILAREMPWPNERGVEDRL